MVLSYLQYIKSIVDELSLIEHRLDDLNLVIYALNGLRHAFCDFTSSIRTCDSPILFYKFYDKPIYFELFLLHEEHTNEALPVNINHVQGCPGQGSGHFHLSMPNSRYGNNNKKQSVVYKYCNQSCHSARTCYKIHCFSNK